MKYRLLTNEELNALEKEFIHFLAANTITASDWVSMKENDPVKALQQVEVFSDMVLEKALSNIKYIEHRSSKELKVFHYMDDKVVLAGLAIDPSLNADLTNPASLKEVTAKLSQSDDALVRVYKVEKKYAKQREVELYAMLESGCLIVDESLFQTLLKFCR